MAWKDQLDDMTNNVDTAEVTAVNLPMGYVVKKEPKKARRTFAMQYSLLDALQKIAEENGTNLNALVNDVLTDYANNYLSLSEDKQNGRKRKNLHR